MKRHQSILAAALLISCNNENSEGETPREIKTDLPTAASQGNREDIEVVELGASLSSQEIRQALSGMIITYEPPNSADAGVHEEFHEDGVWRGVLYGRGPIPFSGDWFVSDNRLCVSSQQAVFGTVVEGVPFCRDVRKAEDGKRIIIAHIGLSDLRPMLAGTGSLASWPRSNDR